MSKITFKEKLNKILQGKYEFTEEEREILKRAWRTEDDIKEEYTNQGYARQKERRATDKLFNEWRKISNKLNVTLIRSKKDGKPRDEAIIKYIEDLEEITKKGFNPDSVRKSKIDWKETFKTKVLVYRQRSKHSDANNRWLMRKCIFEGEELTYGALRARLKKIGRDIKDADNYLIKEN